MNEQGMEPLMGLLVAMVLLSMSVSAFRTMVTGKMDLFWALRMFASKSAKGFGRLCRGLSKACYNWAKWAWRTAGYGRTSLPARVFLYPAAIVFGVGGVIMAVPAEIFSGVTKKKH